VPTLPALSMHDAVFLRAFTGCAHLRRLDLELRTVVDDRALAGAMTELASLTHLRMTDCRRLVSLAWLRAVSPHVTHLTLWRCAFLQPTEVRHLAGVRGLRRLVLDDSLLADLPNADAVEGVGADQAAATAQMRASIARLAPASVDFDRVAYPSLETFDLRCSDTFIRDFVKYAL